MSIPELLVANVFILNTPPQVYELVGGTTLNTIGGPCISDSVENVLTGGKGNVGNRVVEYRGEIFCTYFAGGNILKIDGYNRGTGLWTNRYSGPAGGSNGFYVVNTATIQRLFIFGRSSVGNTNIYYTDDGVTWTAVLGLGINSASSLNESVPIMFNNKLYQSWNFNGHSVYEFDPIAISFSLINVPSTSSTADFGPGDFVVHDDRLLLLSLDHSPGNGGVDPADWVLWEFTGSGFVLNTQITAPANWNDSFSVADGRCCIFRDPNNDNLIALCNGSDEVGTPDWGSVAFRLIPSGGSFTPSELPNLIPAAYRPGVRGVSAVHAEDRWYCVVVNDTAPGTPEVYIFFTPGPAPGTGYSVYAYVNDASELVSPVAGPNASFTFPHQKFGGGLHVHKATGNQAIIENGEPLLGGYKLSYRVYGAIASQTVRLYYSTDQETPDQQATISAQTGGGGIGGGNSVTGVTGDDGVTLFTLTWNIGADGVPSGDASHLMLDIR
jgi:hypothetical protein